MAADIKIQRGTTDIGNAGGTALITPVSNINNAFAINTNNRRMHGGRSDLNKANLEVDDMSGGLFLSATDTLTFIRESASVAANMRFAWEVWEYTGVPAGPNEFIVRGTYTLTLTGESITQAVANIVNIDDCVPHITGILSNGTVDDADSATAIAWMTNGTLNVKRGSGTRNTVRVVVTVVEYTGSNWSVKHGRQEGSGTDTGTVTLRDAADGVTVGGGDVLNWDNALIIHQYKSNNKAGVDDSIADTSMLIEPGVNTTSVNWIFDANHVDSAAAGSREEIFVHVLCNPKLKVTRYSSTASHTGASVVKISPLVSTDLASVEITRTTSGTGTAYGRGWVNATITSTSDVEMWVHRSGNTINTRIQVVDFFQFLSIYISDQGDEFLNVYDTNEIILGGGFNPTQGTGKVELCDSSDYVSGTKVLQTVTSWSDTSIQFNPVFTGLDTGNLWLFVTNSDLELSQPYKVVFGEISYYDHIGSLAPDIHHRFNNSYIDERGVADANSLAVLGAYSFKNTPISRSNSFSWSVDDNASRIEMIDTKYTNTTTMTKRTVGGWIQLDRVHLVPSGFYKEGLYINNIYMVVGFGNIILANMADSAGAPNYKIQGFSDFKLSVNRPYHLMVRFNVSSAVGADDGRFQFFVDGKEVSKYAGLEVIPNQIKDIEFSTHTGDWNYGKPDGNLDTGGTDISYPAATNTLLNDWATWSNRGASSGNLTDQEIKDLFIQGARPTNTLMYSTQAEAQLAIDGLSGTDYIDKPMPIKIFPVGTADLNLTFNNITFDERCSMHICWMGSGNLTITNTGTSNTDLLKCETPNGGTIIIVNENAVNISGVKDGSKIVVLDASDDSVVASIESSLGNFIFTTLAPIIHIIIIKENWRVIQKFDVSISGDTIIPITQEPDYVYDNPI